MNELIKYEKLFHSYYSSLVVYASTFLGDREKAEDIVQELFVKLWERKTFFPKEDESIKRFLYVTTRNSIIDYFRSKENSVRLKSQDINITNIVINIDSEDLESEMEYAEKLRIIKEAVDELPPKCRDIFNKVYFEEKKYSDVAEELNVSLNTIKTQMFRAFSKLKERLSSQITLSIFFYLLYKE